MNRPCSTAPLVGALAFLAACAAPDPPPTGFTVVESNILDLQAMEPRLIEIAYAFEQATRRRVAPELFR